MTDPLKNGTPHLSHSRINRYLHCPEQYRLYYIEHLRPRFPAASLVFGKVIHQALARLFQTGTEPVQWFRDAWEDVKDLDLAYGQRESWEQLVLAGQGLLEQFVVEDLPRLGSVAAVERPFDLTITSLDLPFVGIIDLVADLDDRRTVIDFKTASASCGVHEAHLSDQLTAYQLAEPDTRQAALCVLIKTKTPTIQWHLTRRSDAQLHAFLHKARLVSAGIQREEFYKRPGKWCAWCDYLPVCMGDRRKIAETLMRVEPSL